MLRRIIQALTVNAFGQASSVLIQLATVPLLIRSWGTTYYGEWLLLTTMTAYLSLSDFGMTSALTNALTMSIGQQQTDRAAGQLSSGWRAIALTSMLMAGALAMVLLTCPYGTWFGILTIDASTALTTLGWLMLYNLMAVQSELLSGIYQASQRYALGRLWINGSRLLEFAATVAVVWGLGRAPDVAAAMGLIRSAFVGLMGLDTYRRFGWVRDVAWQRASLRWIRPLLVPSASFMAFAVGHAVVLQGSLLLIGALLSPVYVVRYNTLRTLVNALRQLIGMLNTSFWPELTVALARRQFRVAVQLHRMAVQLAFWGGLLGAVLLALLAPALLLIWTGGRVMVEQPLFTWMLAGTVTYAIWNTSSTTILATNRHQSIALAFLLSSCVAVGSGWLTVPHYGLSGLALGFLVVDLFMVVYVVRRSVALLEIEHVRTLVQYVLADFRWRKRIGSLFDQPKSDGI